MNSGELASRRCGRCLGELEGELGSSRGPIVAIDGVAGAGKSTAARRVAIELGLLYLDTGAMYRGATVAVLRKLGQAGIEDLAVGDDDAIIKAVSECRIEIRPNDRVILDGDDVTQEIRDDPATEWVSRVSAVQGVREILVPLQRELSASGAVVEGRDIGSIVFPDADVKIFLTADVAERAKRRAAERGEAEIADVARRLNARDMKDSSRSVSPLEPAPDAVVIDTTDLTIEDVVERIVGLCETVEGGGD